VTAPATLRWTLEGVFVAGVAGVAAESAAAAASFAAAAERHALTLTSAGPRLVVPPGSLRPGYV
jgi:hypothetical protein